MQAFQLLGDGEQTLHHRLLLRRRLKAGLVGNGLGQGDRLGRVLRDELGQLVDLPVGHFEHAPDIAQHATRQQCSEGDDLCDIGLAIALLHVTDHVLAALDAEIDVEIRHRDALGIEEALEEQAETQGVEIP